MTYKKLIGQRPCEFEPESEHNWSFGVRAKKHIFSNLFSMPNQNLNQLLALGWNRDADTRIHFDSIKLF
jgi:hypothetical protein